MQELKLSSELFPLIYAGAKRATVRSGKTAITPGSLALESGDGGWGIIVKVTDVRHKKVSELTDEEAQLDCADSAQELVSLLKDFYPNIQPTDDITVILFDFFDAFEWLPDGEIP